MHVLPFVLILLTFLFSSKRAAAEEPNLNCYTQNESDPLEKCPREGYGCFSVRCAYDNGTVTLRKGCARAKAASFCQHFEAICVENGGESDCYFCFGDLCNETDYPGQNCSNLIAAGPLCFFIILMLLFFSIILAIISSS
ncbi:hypothetical protein niasHT_039716 [Heterodera trifolii]|uniref:Uncharacterized protein n=1 Tax=Heterodera trifolii TaxID=157864 RepID=A0ABD2IFG3_9BILA